MLSCSSPVCKQLLVRLRARCFRQFSGCRASAEGREVAPRHEQLERSKRCQLESYLKCLLDKNKVMNLTAVKTVEEAIDRHVNDSLSLLPAIEENCSAGCKEINVIDVGSGAGFPGIVLAVEKQEWKVVVLDALKKRCNFVDEAVAKCGIKNVITKWGRAEEVGRAKEHREVYDVAVARAVAQLSVLAEYCLPFVKVGGIMVAAKGPVIEEEIAMARKALKIVGGSLVGSFKVNSFSAEGQRHVVVIRKIKPCPKKYPRPPGFPSKRPL